MSIDSQHADAWSCRQECAALYVAYANAVDFHEDDRVISLFTSDAVMHRMGAVLSGHAGIREYLRNRSRSQVIRHVMTNMEIFPESPTAAKGICYFIAFIEPGKNGDTDLPTTGPTVMGEIHGEFRRSDESWKFSKFDARLTFVKAKA